MIDLPRMQLQRLQYPYHCLFFHHGYLRFYGERKEKVCFVSNWVINIIIFKSDIQPFCA